VTRLLLINPNISDSVTALIRAEAEHSASPGTTLEVLTAPFGVAYIETRCGETVESYGLGSRLASIRGLDEALADIGNVQSDQGERLVELAERCVTDDGADVIVLAGAPLAGLARTLRGRLPVPCVDGVSSAVRHAESLVALQCPVSGPRRRALVALEVRRPAFRRPSTVSQPGA
jgi:Asp/Glu/hydantoin racemase